MLAATSPSSSVNPKALGWAIGVHALLLLIFIFWRYQLPAYPVSTDEMGMEVNIGTSADGFGNAQPLELGDPAVLDVPSYGAQAGAASTETGFEADGDEVVAASPVTMPNRDRRQENRQATTNRQTANTTNTRTNATERRPQQPKFVYQGASGTGGNNAAQQAAGGSEGNTQGNGDRGVPGGTPGASNYEGTPGNGGTGIRWQVGDRRVVDFPGREAEFREGGKVVLRVTVNRDGEIIRSNLKSSSSAALTAIAQQKLKKVRFNKNYNAPPEQFGEVVFDFKARK